MAERTVALDIHAVQIKEVFDCWIHLDIDTICRMSAQSPIQT